MAFIEFYEYFIFSFLTIIAIINPLSKIAIFPSLLGKFDEKTRHNTVNSALIIAMLIFFGASLIGGYILSLLEINLFSLRIVGGIVLFYIAFKLIAGVEQRRAEEKAEKAISMEAKEIVFSPLAFPLLAGPGSAAIGMILFTQAPDIYSKIGFIAAATSVFIINYFVIMKSKIINSMLGEDGIKIMGKIVGILVAAIGIQLIVIGIKEAFGMII